MRKTKKQSKNSCSFIYKDKKMGVALLLFVFISSILFTTFAWYQNQVSLSGSSFKTGTIDFIATGFNNEGNQVTTILQDDKDLTEVPDAGLPLFNKTGWQAGVTETAYIVIENTGSLSMEYKISFSAAGDIEYLGGFWYALADITENLPTSGSDSEKLQAYIASDPTLLSESDGYNMATMSRYATYGSISKDGVQKRYYRLDYGMCATATPVKYTNKTVAITPTIYVTQEGAMDHPDGGYTYNCSSKADIEKARDSCLPGDSIKLMNSFTFEGDLIFNKAVNILTNNYTLTVEGNLIYDFSSPKDFTINATGNGIVKVASPAEGVGGNFIVNTPLSNVTFTGSGSGASDIIVDEEFSVNATRSYGESGVTFSRVNIVSGDGTPVTVYVEDDTRVTVSENTNIIRLEAVAKSKNIEVQNAGTITTLALSGMNMLPQPISPQIYVVNMGYIVNAIELPSWSLPFIIVNPDPRTCTGNTRIVQTITGNSMSVTGAEGFTADDIERESTNIYVAPVGNNDSELIVYYQNLENNPDTSISDLLENYFIDRGLDPASKISQIRRLDIVSIGDKVVDNDDIEYLTGDDLRDLVYLDLGRASVYDSGTDTANKLCDNAFKGKTKFKTLVLPQNLKAIGVSALANLGSRIIVTIPGSVTEFGNAWYRGNAYVAFGASTPPQAAYDATNGMSNIKAIFVEEYYVDSYKTAYADKKDVIFPMAQLDDSEVHFVRQVPATGEWEIVFYIGNATDELTVGGSLHLNGSVINVTGVGDRAYKNALNNAQISIKFADGVKYIGESAFADTDIIGVSSWGKSLTTIGNSAFYGCTGLTGEVYLPNSMETIGEKAFLGCTGITGFDTGGTDTVNSSAFSGCSALVWVNMPSVQTLEQSGSSDTSGMFYYDNKLVSVKLPSLKRTVGLIFNRNTALREIVFGSEMYDNIAESGKTSFNNSSNFGSPKIFFKNDDVSGITITNVTDSTKLYPIYPLGEKYGELLVDGYDIGEYIMSDTLRDDGTATIITANSSSTISGDFSILAEWKGLPVTAIYKNAFSVNGFSSATLYFPDTLEEIGEGAFYNPSGEKSIVDIGSWGTSLKTIGNSAFRNTALTGSLELPADVLESVGDYAFSGCKKLTSVNTGSASRLGISVFLNCSTITSAELPEVESVAEGSSASNNNLFSKCSSLVVANLPKLSLVNGSGLFDGCTSLREIYAKNPTPAFGGTPFTNISAKLREKLKIYVPEEYVATYRASGVHGLYYCIFPDNGIKVGEMLVGSHNIGKYILGDNGDGTYTIITTNDTYTGNVDMDDIPELQPYHITKIGSYAFVNYRYQASSSTYFTSQTFTTVDLTVGSDVTEIEDYAFAGAKGILSIDLRNTKTVGAEAFRYCTGLTSIIGKNLETTGTYAFSGCTAITTLTFEKLTFIDTYSFYSCSALVSVNLPAAETIRQYAFYSDTKLENVYLESLQNVESNSFNKCSALTEFIINKVIEESSDVPVGNKDAFKNATNVRVLVPIMYRSFYEDTWSGRTVGTFDKTYTDVLGNIYIVKLDDSESECLIEHFIGIAGTVGITVPDVVTVDDSEYKVMGIGKGAFKSVSATVTSVTLPNTMYYFAPGCLSELTALTDIYVAEDNRFYSATNGILFSSDDGMLVKYPAGRQETIYFVDDTVYAIGEYAFEGCTGLESVTFGVNLTVIDSTAFAGCTLVYVTFTGDTPPIMMGTNIFDTTVEGFSMTVPEARVDDYVRSMNFARYAKFINNGTEIPEDGQMNVLPWNLVVSMSEYVALPPEASEDYLPKPEGEDEDDLTE